MQRKKNCNIKGPAQQRLLGGATSGATAAVALSTASQGAATPRAATKVASNIPVGTSSHALEGYSKPSYTRRTKEEELDHYRGATPNLQGMAKSHRPRQEMETPHQQMKE